MSLVNSWANLGPLLAQRYLKFYDQLRIDGQTIKQLPHSFEVMEYLVKI